MTDIHDLDTKIKNVLIGGNHLASSLLQTDDPAKYRKSDYYNVLRKFDQPFADMWVAWKAIMELRDAYKSPSNQSSLDQEASTCRLVWTVYRTDDESNHIFSTNVKAQEYADSLDCPCVISSYVIDEPKHFYGVQQ